MAIYSGIYQICCSPEESTREGKIKRYCNAVAAWTAKERAVLEGFQFSLNSAANQTVCTNVASPIAPAETDVSKMSDGACSNYVPLHVQCDQLDRLVPEPEAGGSYRFDIYSQATRSLLSSRRPLGALDLPVATVQMQDVRYSRSKSCGTDCARKKAERSCERANGHVTGSNDESVQCRLLYRLKDPCFVLDDVPSPSGSVDTWSLDTDMWNKEQKDPLWGVPIGPGGNSNGAYLPQARCLNPYTYGLIRAGHEALSPSEHLITTDALRQITTKVNISLRSQHDPYVVASRLSNSNFDFGMTQGQMQLGGVLILCIGICFCCIPCCCFVICSGCDLPVKRSIKKRGMSIEEEDDDSEEYSQE